MNVAMSIMRAQSGIHIRYGGANGPRRCVAADAPIFGRRSAFQEFLKSPK
jgi:hypothetical protein